MSWSQVSEGRWERPGDSMEGAIAAMAQITVEACGREVRPYTLHTKVKLNITNMTSTDDIEPALRYAWKKLRFEQPNLAVTTENNKQVYEVPEDESAVQKWLQETFIVDSSSPDGEQAYQRVNFRGQSLLTYVPKSCELLLSIAHCLIDGVGILQFWDRFLTAVTEPVTHISFGTEHTRLPPTIGEVFGCPENPPPENVERFKKLTTEWSDIFPGVGHVTKNGTVSPGRCLNMQIKFPADKTEAIIRTCKSKGITVTTAIHAAYVIVLAKNPHPSSRKSHYASFDPFNLRRYMPEPYNGYAVALYLAVFGFHISLPSTYWDVVKALDTHYKTPFKDSNKEEDLKFVKHTSDALMSAFGNAKSKPTIAYTDAIVSSWGLAEVYCKRSYASPSVHIEVEDVCPGCDIVDVQPSFLYYTFRDQLNLVHAFNDAFQDPADVRAFYDQVEKVLDEKLLS